MKRFSIDRLVRLVRPASALGAASSPRLLAVVAIAGLAIASCAKITLRQGWSDDLGPVIPHDTFPADCSLCHRGDTWNELREDFAFDHEAQTGVKLEGAHAQAQCLLCHNDRGPVAQFAAKGCAGCHVDEHRGTLGADCALCHDQVNWRPSEMIAQHDRTRFPLVGAHAATACRECHPGAPVGNFAGADPTCTNCHMSDVAQTVDHLALGWTEDCDRCHRPIGWSPAAFRAHPSSFPLTAGHGGLRCSECHVSGSFAGLSTDCVTCHLADYNATDDPPHAAAGFSTDCAQCHTTSRWNGAGFLHPFPLTAGHGGLDCADCHAGGVYVGLSSDCVSCHLSDYNNADDPNHVAAGFPTDCTQCHNTSNWGDGNFSHNAFPLSGPHNVSCNDCHLAPGNFMSFSCTHCHAHRQSKMDDEHEDVGGYRWSSPACYNCHPDGHADD